MKTTWFGKRALAVLLIAALLLPCVHTHETAFAFQDDDHEHLHQGHVHHGPVGDLTFLHAPSEHYGGGHGHHHHDHAGFHETRPHGHGHGVHLHFIFHENPLVESLFERLSESGNQGWHTHVAVVHAHFWNILLPEDKRHGPAPPGSKAAFRNAKEQTRQSPARRLLTAFCPASAPKLPFLDYIHLSNDLPPPSA